MKKASNYGIAALVFIITMVLINGAGILLAIGASVIGLAIGGSAGVELVYDFMMNHLNLYSCLIYVIPGTVFLLWYYFAFIEPQGLGRFVDAQTAKAFPGVLYMARATDVCRSARGIPAYGSNCGDCTVSDGKLYGTC